ncbi:MAG: hypothetical protein O3B03_00325 [Proteobacteria bacterium]|nr:hypothetical protein [Pseudomonadota bacterium]MDA1332216.1 hypothetical protein [Pseudomonadota bacterium]
MLIVSNTKNRLGWLLGFFLCGLATLEVVAAEVTFEDAQIRTVHARKAMEEMKRPYDAAIEKSQTRRATVADLTAKLKAAQAELDEAEVQVLSLEKEYEKLQKIWAEEAKRLKEIHSKERR